MIGESTMWFIVKNEIRAIEEKNRTWKITYKSKIISNKTIEIKTHVISFEIEPQLDYSPRVILPELEEPYVVVANDLLFISEGEKEFACANVIIYTQKSFIKKKLELLNKGISLSNRELNPFKEEIKSILENKLRTGEAITQDNIAELNNALFSYRDVIPY